VWPAAGERQERRAAALWVAREIVKWFRERD
jgi:hypothetical protein